nr:efflux RND transporter periplasmic adaptor subunit [Marinomonas ostreistagni]
MQVTPQALPLTLEAIGSLTAVQQVMLSPEMAGRVQAINFESGQSVDQGALLLQLNSAPEQAALASAKANVRFAQSQLQRTEKLNRTGVEPLDALQMRRSTYDQAAAEVTRLEAQLRQKQIVAPFTGELGIRQVNLGQYINPGEAVVSLTALDKLYVEFSIPQQHLAALQQNAEVTLTSDAYPEQTFTAYVNAVEPQVNANTRNIRVQALLDNREQTLRPGMYVNVALAIDTREAAIVVPNTAVQTSAQGHMVTVVRGDNATEQGNAEVVPVEVGERIGEQILIRSGLQANDVIVTVGQNRLQPGAEVTVTELIQGEEQ